METNIIRMINISTEEIDGSSTILNMVLIMTAEWFGWLHYKTDKPPTEKAPVAHPWIQEHTANTSGSSAGSSTLMGSSNAYMPYTTTKPKIESWVPPKK